MTNTEFAATSAGIYAVTRPVKDALADIVDRADELGPGRGGFSIEPHRVRRETDGLLESIARAERDLLELMRQADNTVQFYYGDKGR